MIKISLVGSVNVGKSTIFNILTKNKSLVSNFSGTTRDIKYGKFIYNNNIIFIDTGGLINYPDKKFSNNIYEKTILSIKESNIIFFITEYNEELIHLDKKIFNILNSYKKEIILIINKIDKNNYFKDLNLFNLKKIFYISAIKKNSFKELLKYINSLKKKKNKNKYDFILEKKYNIKILIIGKSNVGKSTLINNITNYKRLIVSKYSGTTIEFIDVHLNKKNNNFIFTDSYGIDSNFIIKNDKNLFKKNIFSKIFFYDVILFIIDITNNVSNFELDFINKIDNSGKLLIIVINKIDLIEKNKLCNFKNYLYKKFNFIKYIKIFYISAILNINTKEILNFINKLFILSKSLIKTKKSNNILSEALLKYNPYKYKKISKPKFKYSYFISNNPYKLIIHGKNLNLVDNFYKRYLENFFRNKLNIKNISIKIIFKNK